MGIGGTGTEVQLQPGQRMHTGTGRGYRGTGEWCGAKGEYSHSTLHGVQYFVDCANKQARLHPPLQEPRGVCPKGCKQGITLF